MNPQEEIRDLYAENRALVAEYQASPDGAYRDLLAERINGNATEIKVREEAMRIAREDVEAQRQELVKVGRMDGRLYYVLGFAALMVALAMGNSFLVCTGFVLIGVAFANGVKRARLSYRPEDERPPAV